MLVSVPSRKVIVTKSLFNVSDCRMHWQGAGDYLCVKVDRHTKTKKSTYTNFELFKIRSKNVPIEVLEHKDAILAFAWEPAGSRFAIIHSSNPNQKLDVTFYDMKKDGVVALKVFFLSFFFLSLSLCNLAPSLPQLSSYLLFPFFFRLLRSVKLVTCSGLLKADLFFWLVSVLLMEVTWSSSTLMTLRLWPPRYLIFLSSLSLSLFPFFSFFLFLVY